MHQQHALFYAFLLFSLLVRVIEKVRRQGSGTILLVPFWPCQIWFPMLMDVSQCLFIPQHPDLMSIGQVHHCNLNHFSLGVWTVGTKIWYFLRKSTMYFCSHTNIPQENPIHISGDNFPTDVERKYTSRFCPFAGYTYLLHLKANDLAFSSLKVLLAAIFCYHSGTEGASFIEEVS